MKQYMVIERFKAGCVDQIYQRLADSGRMLPDGLFYINSWVNREEHICFQLMETSDNSLFDIWFEKWADLVDFERVLIDEKTV